jgi:hypothetical protein
VLTLAPSRIGRCAALLSDERALAAWRRVGSHLRVEALDTATQNLLPQLHRNLQALGTDDPLLGLFKGVHRHAWARNQLLLAEILPVIATDKAAGVPTMLLKGGALLADERHFRGGTRISMPPASHLPLRRLGLRRHARRAIHAPRRAGGGRPGDGHGVRARTGQALAQSERWPCRRQRRTALSGKRSELASSA